MPELDDPLASYRRAYDCDGCGKEQGGTELLHFAAPLGLTAVWTCRRRECAIAARDKRGGGQLVQPKVSPQEQEHLDAVAARRERDRLAELARRPRGRFSGINLADVVSSRIY